MEVIIDGSSKGSAALVRIYHQAQAGPGAPQVMVIYASGFIRLKQNADPSPPIPFGSSFILGPAYWPNPSTYYHNPQLSRLELVTEGLPTAPLRLKAEGQNHDFEVGYEMALPPPRDRQTRLHVTQRYTATKAVTIDPLRRGEAQGFKLVQLSSMFINQGQNCTGNVTDCHDSNAARFIDSELIRYQVPFTSASPSTFIFSPTRSLGSTWLDALHTDNESWQGNTPNVRVALDSLPLDRTITPQGFITASTDPNDDNVNLWLHDDGVASQSWAAGKRDQVSYWLMAQDDPPDPWAELGLRQGFTFLNFEGSYNCFPVLPGPPVTASAGAIAGYRDTAFELQYNLGSVNSAWAQLRCNFNPPLDLSGYDHLRFDWRGSPGGGNSLEVALINPGIGQDYIFGRGYPHASQHNWWGQMVVPFTFLQPWTPGTQFDPGKVSGFFVSIVKDPVDDAGGIGQLAIDNLAVTKLRSRQVPAAFEEVAPNPAASIAAVNWLISQQQSSGLLKSWAEEEDCIAHTYDQALALLVFSWEGRWTAADKLVEALVKAQQTDGAWSKSHDCSQSSLPEIHSEKWEGDIAWAIYALSRYIDLGGDHPQAGLARKRAADWLTTRLNPTDGCLMKDHTEGTIDAWWALYAAGAAYGAEAEGLKNCLLTDYWDEEMGRFKGGKNWWQPYLDNQSWGAAFLKAIGQNTKALRALSYAQETLRLPAQGGQLFGFDGQAGPWSVWNEGTGQYVALRGKGAADLALELLAQQRQDGAVLGSPDEFNGGGVWTTRWHGVAPTAWLYYALHGTPLYPNCDQGPLNPASTAWNNLDHTAADWGVFCERGPTWIKKNVSAPSLDGKALQCGITGGLPYSNVHCYRNLLPQPAANKFWLTLSFLFTPTTTYNNGGSPSRVQALEFTMNKWDQSKRYEFALQWQNVGPGAPQWRYWDPHRPSQERWVAFSPVITQQLTAGKWYTLTLAGEVVSGTVHYNYFILDQKRHSLDITLPPVAAPPQTGNSLAVAVQLDGNSSQAPYNLFLDRLRFIRTHVDIRLPLVLKKGD